LNRNLLKICFVAALLLSASSAYAVSNLTGATVIGGGTFSPSNKVNIQAVASSTAYAAQSKHLSGDRQLGTTNLDPKIYWTTATVGSAAGSPANASAIYTSWTTL
jgi:hypothetical protein